MNFTTEYDRARWFQPYPQLPINAEDVLRGKRKFGVQKNLQSSGIFSKYYINPFDKREEGIPYRPSIRALSTVHQKQQEQTGKPSSFSPSPTNRTQFAGIKIASPISRSPQPSKVYSDSPYKHINTGKHVRFKGIDIKENSTQTPIKSSNIADEELEKPLDNYEELPVERREPSPMTHGKSQSPIPRPSPPNEHSDYLPRNLDTQHHNSYPQHYKPINPDPYRPSLKSPSNPNSSIPPPTYALYPRANREIYETHSYYNPPHPAIRLNRQQQGELLRLKSELFSKEQELMNLRNSPTHSKETDIYKRLNQDIYEKRRQEAIRNERKAMIDQEIWHSNAQSFEEMRRREQSHLQSLEKMRLQKEAELQMHFS